jgi:transposase
LSEKGKDFVSLIKPETVSKWQRNLIKGFCTFPSNKPRIGRPPVPVQIKELILEMKNRNLYWSYKRIQGELLKLGIELDIKTIWNILHEFRRKGKVKRGVSWKRFLKSHIKSLYAMDFFTVDTVLNQRF